MSHITKATLRWLLRTGQNWAIGSTTIVDGDHLATE